jgi:hypothetical protein
MRVPDSRFDQKRDSERKANSMRGKLVLAAGVVGCVLTAASLAGAGEKTEAKGGIEAKAAFAQLKTLKGTWKGEIVHDHQAAQKKEHSDHHPDQATVTFKLTGAGSALIETQFPGSDHEMVSVYHLDGDDLRMTHYCAMGNQPRVKLDRAHSQPDHLIFLFDGGTNLDPEKDMHIHGLEISFHQDGKVTSAWEGYVHGKKMGITSFNMTRQ